LPLVLLLPAFYAVILSETKDPRICFCCCRCLFLSLRLPLFAYAVILTLSLPKGKDPDTLNLTKTLRPFQPEIPL
jgi:hypothetical protein